LSAVVAVPLKHSFPLAFGFLNAVSVIGKRLAYVAFNIAIIKPDNVRKT
jgi:hypothetical protein